MNLFQSIGVCLLIFHCSDGQLFPFSNLRAFFEPKNKHSKNNDQVSNPGINITRPHRQADHNNDPHLPALPEFSSPGIFEINRDIDNHRYSTSSESPTSRRRGTGGKYRSKYQELSQEETSDAIFITPKPNHDFTQSGNDETYYNTVKPKRTRRRKPQVQDLETIVDHQPYPNEEHNSQFHFSKDQIPEVAFPSEEPPYVENIPSLSVAIEENQYGKQDSGLVDYLVPPQLPSVYEKSFKRQKLRNSQGSSKGKLKVPSPTGISKKESRLRVKKHRGEIKSTSIPLAERTTKRHVARRRPSHLPPRRPAGEKAHGQFDNLQQQAAHMDEQITAETGFSGSSSHLHPSSHHGGSGSERVEFQMHGQKGPHSYKFGYDTGKGHNRQFRFEEKDNNGRVKGHYGYYDKNGKLQIVNYEADPHLGFKAESV